MLLKWKPVITKLTEEIIQYITDNNLEGKYVAIFLLSDDTPSEVYVGKKAKKAEQIGLYADIKLGKDRSVEEVIDEIQQCNLDPDCIGMMVQLPLAEHLKPYQMRILDTILPEKDVDGLGSRLFGLAWFGLIDFVPATPKATLEILKYYKLDDYRGKTVTIVWTSNLIGKPLAVELMKRGATVITCNSKTDKDFFKQALASSHYIMAATGRKHLINKEVLDWDVGKVSKPRLQDNAHVPLLEKVLVDIGRGIDEGGAYGDIDWKYYEDKVKAVTPVPGGVGPVTVTCLFHNIKTIGEQREKIAN